MRLNEQEMAYALALMEAYGATFDFYSRVDSHLPEEKRRFKIPTERVGLLDAINDGLRLELSEKIKHELSQKESEHTYEDYSDEELAQAYADTYSINQTEEELWGAGVTVED